MKFIIYLSLIILIFSCSKSPTLVSDTATGSKNNTTRIDTIENTVFKYEATDSFVDVVIGPLVDSSNNKVTPTDIFKIYSETTGLTVGQKNAAANSSFVSSIEINPESDGTLKFRAKLPTTAGLNNIFIQALNKESAIGKIFFQVEPTAIANIGKLSTRTFQDTAPYDNIKQDNENYALIDSQDVVTTLGPIVDKYGNLVQKGNIDVFVTNAVLDNESGITNKVIAIDNGYAYFSVIGIGSDPADVTQITEAQIAVADSDLGVTLPTLQQSMVNNPTRVKNSTLNILSEDLKFTDSVVDFNFGVIYIGNSLSKTFTLTNQGNATVRSLVAQVDPPFSVTGGTCVSNNKIDPNGTCTIIVSIDANARQLVSSNLKVDGKYNEQPLESVVELLTAQLAYPANLQVQLENNLVEFPNHPVGELATQSFIVINTGDVSAKNIRFTNPNPYPGQNTSFYTFKSLDTTVPNDDPFGGEHCGTEFPPQVKCKVYVEYFPTAQVGNDMLSGSIISDEISPVSIFVKGKSYVNNYERILGINSAKYKIRKDEADSSDVIVGPLRDLYGVPVANQLVQIELYRYADASQTIKDFVGNVASSNIILGGKPNTYTIKTDEQGYANFTLKSKYDDNVGVFNIAAKVIDDDGNILSEGIREFEFLGTKLHFDQELYNFSKVIIGQSATRLVQLINDGSMDALNVGIAVVNGNFQISDEGNCSGIKTSSLNLAINDTCSFYIQITPQSRRSYFDQLKITTSTIGNKIPSDIYAIGINPLRFNSETPIIVDTKIIGDPNPLHQTITFTNIGDELGTTLTAFSEKENQSFTFSFDCTTLDVGRSCILSFNYLPTVIPDQILSTNIVIKGIGFMSNLGAEVKIPIEINHSSMKFANEEPGININDCFPLRILAAEVDNSDLDFSQDVGLFLRSSGTGTYYADNNCSNTISTITIPANQYKTSLFYYKPTVAGIHILRGDSNQLSSAIKSFVVYKDPANIEMVSNNFQVAYIGKQIPKPIVVKVVDEDGKGVPNIPVELKFLEDIGKKSNGVSNGLFSSGIAGWTVNSGVSWFNGYSGVMKLFSKDVIAESISGGISVNAGQTYYYTVKVVDSFGAAGASDIVVNLEGLDGTVIQSNEISGKATGAYVVKIPVGVDTVKIRIKTKGMSKNTLVYVDNVIMTTALGKVANDPNIFGTVSNEIKSTFRGPGELTVNFQTGKVPMESLINATSNASNYTTGKNLLIANSVEYVTNIQGALGNFALLSTGPVLSKNGVDNLATLQAMSGYNWNATSKTLTLPANRSYDFATIQTEAGTTIDFKPPTNASGITEQLGWTSVYAKDSCILDGKMQNKNFTTDGFSKPYSIGTVDNDVVSASVAAYDTGLRGGNGGGALYQNYYTSRGCSRNWRGRVRCGGWGGWRIIGSGADGAVSSGSQNSNDEILSILKGGTGFKGRNNRYFSHLPEQSDPNNKNNGGSGGARGKNGGLLFVNCYMTMAGSGTVDVSGVKADNGQNGTLASNYYADSGQWCQAYYHGNCWQLRFDRFLNGYGGGGSGGDGGDGGTVIFKTKANLSTIQSNVGPGAGGTAGVSGSVYGSLGQGTPGSTGRAGKIGKCLFLDGNNDILSTCDGTTIVSVPRSCNELLSRNPSYRNQNGIYQITPSGNAADSSISVYCDMTVDGGGWTMIARSVQGGSSTNFGWKYGTGSPMDNSSPYSYDLNKNKIKFSETMLASYTTGNTIQYAYKQSFALANMEANQTSSFNMVATPVPVAGTNNSGFYGAVYAGQTNLNGLFFFNDSPVTSKSVSISGVTSNYNNFGLAPGGWFPVVSDYSDQNYVLRVLRSLYPSEGYYGFKLDIFDSNPSVINNHVQGMIFVR